MTAVSAWSACDADDAAVMASQKYNLDDGDEVHDDEYGAPDAVGSRAVLSTSRVLPSDIHAELSSIDIEDAAKEVRPTQKRSAVAMFNVRSALRSQIFTIDVWRKLRADPGIDRCLAQLPESIIPPDKLEHVLESEVLTLMPRFFGSPLSRFWTALERGELTEASVNADQRKEAQHQAAFVASHREQHNELVHKLHMLKRTLKPAVPRLPKAFATTLAGKGGSGNSLMYSKDVGGLVRRNKLGAPAPPLGRPNLQEQGTRRDQPAPGQAPQQRGGHPTGIQPIAGLIAGFPTAPFQPPPAAQTFAQQQHLAAQLAGVPQPPHSVSMSHVSAAQALAAAGHHFAFSPPGAAAAPAGLPPSVPPAHQASCAARYPACASQHPLAGMNTADATSVPGVGVNTGAVGHEMRSPNEPSAKRARTDTPGSGGA